MLFFEALKIPRPDIESVGNIGNIMIDTLEANRDAASAQWLRWRQARWGVQ